VYVKRLRRKLGDACIHTHYGFGYRLCGGGRQKVAG
jgi:DNA-binding response OmpR family regulator